MILFFFLREKKKKRFDTLKHPFITIMFITVIPLSPGIVTCLSFKEFIKLVKIFPHLKPQKTLATNHQYMFSRDQFLRQSYFHLYLSNYVIRIFFIKNFALHHSLYQTNKEIVGEMR